MFSSLQKKITVITYPAQLFVEDYNLGTLVSYSLYGQNRLKFVPVNGYKKSFLMMGPSHYITEQDLPSEFPVHIQYNMNDSRSLKSLESSSQCNSTESILKKRFCQDFIYTRKSLDFSMGFQAV